MSALAYTIIPASAVIAGAILSLLRTPGARLVSAMQHLAAGVVFAAAATEILPQIKHDAAPVATLIGGAVGVGAMLLLKALEARATGSLAMIGAVAIDILVDGLVLGLAFLAGEKAGILLTIALTLEVLFLGLTLTSDLRKSIRAAWKVVAVVAAIGLLLPLGAVLATPVRRIVWPCVGLRQGVEGRAATRSADQRARYVRTAGVCGRRSVPVRLERGLGNAGRPADQAASGAYQALAHPPVS